MGAPSALWGGLPPPLSPLCIWGLRPQRSAASICEFLEPPPEVGSCPPLDSARKGCALDGFFNQRVAVLSSMVGVLWAVGLCPAKNRALAHVALCILILGVRFERPGVVLGEVFRGVVALALKRLALGAKGEVSGSGVASGG